jgi:hypothetical protein
VGYVELGSTGWRGLQDGAGWPGGAGYMAPVGLLARVTGRRRLASDPPSPGGRCANVVTGWAKNRPYRGCRLNDGLRGNQQIPLEPASRFETWTIESRYTRHRIVRVPSNRRVTVPLLWAGARNAESDPYATVSIRPVFRPGPWLHPAAAAEAERGPCHPADRSPRVRHSPPLRLGDFGETRMAREH